MSQTERANNLSEEVRNNVKRNVKAAYFSSEPSRKAYVDLFNLFNEAISPERPLSGSCGDCKRAVKKFWITTTNAWETSEKQ